MVRFIGCGIHPFIGNEDHIEDAPVEIALDEAAAIDDPAHSAMLRDDAVVYGIVGLLPLVQVAGVDLLPDARVHLLIVIRMDDAAESALRVSEEVIEIVTLEQGDEFLIGKEDFLALCIVDQDGSWQIEDDIAQREAHLHAAPSPPCPVHNGSSRSCRAA